jgi:hypothetical protein
LIWFCHFSLAEDVVDTDNGGQEVGFCEKNVFRKGPMSTTSLQPNYIEAPCSKTCRRAQVESLRGMRSLVQFNF